MSDGRELEGKDDMSIITVLVVLVVLGLVVYLIENYVPMAAPFKTVFRVVVVLLLVLWLLQAFGIWKGFHLTL